MSSAGTAFPPPPGFTHADIHEMLAHQQQMRRLVGLKRSNAKPNDWLCESEGCSTWNHEKRTKCTRCKHQRRTRTMLYEDVERKLAEMDRPVNRSSNKGKNGWVCTGCGNVNWQWRDTCNMCSNQQPTLQATREGSAGGHFDRQDKTDRLEYNSESEEYDSYGRKRKRLLKI